MKKRPLSKLIENEAVYGRTDLGQAVYDVLFSGMSAAKCARRHPDLTRDWILKIRRENRKLRPEARRTK